MGKETIHNPDANQDWTVAPESLKQYQHYVEHFPEGKGLAACLKWHLQGFCYKGCPWCHAFKPQAYVNKFQKYKDEFGKAIPIFLGGGGVPSGFTPIGHLTNYGMSPPLNIPTPVSNPKRLKCNSDPS
jgi:hypothetical protein